MKRINPILYGVFGGMLSLTPCYAEADVEVPCLVFSGESDNGFNADLSKFNRIYFTNGGMTLSSSRNGENTDQQDIPLSYSQFHHFEIRNAVPTITSDVSSVEEEGESQLIFDSTEKALLIVSPSNVHFRLEVFDLNGTMLMRDNVLPTHSVSLTTLSPGVYIATAFNGETNLSIKFNIR